MSIDKQGGKIAFVCDVCSARFEAEDTDLQPPGVHALWVAAEKQGWHSRQQRGGKWHTACPECATDDWKLWNWKWRMDLYLDASDFFFSIAARRPSPRLPQRSDSVAIGGESTLFPGADVVPGTEGNTDVRDIASAQMASSAIH